MNISDKQTIDSSIPTGSYTLSSTVTSSPGTGSMYINNSSQFHHSQGSIICTQDYVDSKMFGFGYSGIFTWIDKIITKISSTFKISSDYIDICCSKRFEQYCLVIKLFDEEICKIDLNISYAGNEFPSDQIREIIDEIERLSFVWKVNMLNM